MPTWLERTTPIVSTDFMKSEIEKFYPDFGAKTQVVPIAPMSHGSPVDRACARASVEGLGIPEDYILCPTHAVSHKNAGPLLTAQSILRKKGHKTALVFVGSGTEVMNGRACAIGLERGETPQDVYGLGYVTNTQIDALIQCARIVVNPSLYEGGNGPGFEAWSQGIPVAMSHIPPFLEHLRVHDVRAAIFDPRSPEDIAEKLESLLLNPEKAAADGAHSKQAMGHFTWRRAAEAYLTIIEDILMVSSR
jgi:glycosyltransferase involved in cell wall biosynthesis